MKISKVLLSALALSVAVAAQAADPPKREFRSVWMAAMGIDWPHGSSVIGNEAASKAQFIEYIENFKRHNFNGICVHVRPLADAYYVSTLEPWSASLTGVRGRDPGWDPLAFAVEECHKRGLECYAWVNPFRIDKDGKVNTTPFDLEWREKGWELKSGNWTIFNPGHPDARKHCLDVIKEIYTNYAIDGILFDDYFYPGDHIGLTSSAGDYQMWKDANSGMSLADWRRNNVNTFVQEVYDEIQADRPDMRFGIGPAGTAGASASRHGVKPPTVGSDWQYDGIFADPLAWLDDGSIDFISPQIYWARAEGPAYFTPLADWWNEMAQHFGRHNYISMASYKVDKPLPSFGGNNETGWNEFVAQIEIARKNATDNAPGQIYFSAVQFDGPAFSGLGDWLETHSYQRKALVPVVDWKDHPTYDAPADASFDGTTLSWTATKGAAEQSIIRYTVYAVPSEYALEDVSTPEGGIDNRYLLDVSYATSFTIPENKREGHWYAVCVYDGYGYEYEPAKASYPDGRSLPTTLLKPEAEAVADWDAELTWTAVDGATYVAEVSTSPDFTTFVARQTNLTEPRTTVDLSDIPNNSKLYCRVAVCQPDKFYNYTEPRMFYAPTRVVADKAALLTPADGETVESRQVEFSWQPVTNAERYLVQLCRSSKAENADFSKPYYTATVKAPETKLSVDVSSIGFGDFCWRVVVGGRRVYESMSEPAVFSIARPAVGTFEPGYTVRHDGSTGETIGNLITGNEWFRTIADETAPLVFEENGSLNRSMCVTENFVYVTGRTANSATADAYLRQYDLYTGELIRTIELTPADNVATLPCNQIVRDDAGGIYIFDQSKSASSRRLYLNHVDVATGKLTEKMMFKSKTTTSSGPVDFATLRGNVSSGSYTVYAAISNKKAIVRWVVENDELVDTKTTTFSKLSGDATNFGAAPRICPVSDNLVWVDTDNAPTALYDLDGGSIVATLADFYPEASTWATKDNGIAALSMPEADRHALFASTGTTSESGARIAMIPVKGPHESASPMDVPVVKYLPGKSMGLNNEAGGSVAIDCIKIDKYTAYMVVYSPGNGLSCYSLNHTLSVGDITADADMAITVQGTTVTLGRQASSLRIYTPSGALVSAHTDCSGAELPCAGIYIVRADSHAAVVVAR